MNDKDNNIKLNRETRRQMKKKIAPIAKEVVRLEREIQKAKDSGELNEEEVAALEELMEKIMAPLNMFQLLALEDYIASYKMLDNI